MQYLPRSITEIQAPSDAAECSRLRKVICLLAYATFRSQSAVSDVELAVGEAFSNAIKHGESGSKVSVRVQIPSSRQLAVEMEYRSGEFDTAVTCPDDVENASGGFGRYIMCRMVDSMEYIFDNGITRLRMTKRR